MRLDELRSPDNPGCEMRPDDRRSPGGVQRGDDGDEPRVCCGSSGPERRTGPEGGVDGVEPRSGGSDGEARDPEGDGRVGVGDGRDVGVGDERGVGEGRDKPFRLDDESSLTAGTPTSV